MSLAQLSARLAVYVSCRRIAAMPGQPSATSLAQSAMKYKDANNAIVIVTAGVDEYSAPPKFERVFNWAHTKFTRAR